MKIYGLFGFTHCWAKTLTVMSPAGASAARAHIDAGDDVATCAGAGRLTRHLEKRQGALDRLVAAYGIVVLAKHEWDARKAALGDAIWR